MKKLLINAEQHLNFRKLFKLTEQFLEILINPNAFLHCLKV